MSALRERFESLPELHTQALGSEGAEAVDQTLRLLGDTIDGLEFRYGANRSDRQAATILLVVHGQNLFWQGIEISCRGSFDVAPYLLRPLYETASKVYAAVRDEPSAEQVLRQQLRASDARKWTDADLRRLGQVALADKLEAKRVREAPAADNLAHTGAAHLGAMVVTTSGGLQAREFQWMDPRACRQNVAAFLERVDFLLEMLVAAVEDDVPIAVRERWKRWRSESGPWANAQVAPEESEQP